MERNCTVNLTDTPTKRYFISTFGCQMNDHESEKIRGILEDLSYIECKSEDNADIIVVNTCCIRDTAEQKIRGYIGSLKKLKTASPNLQIILCGCMTQQANIAQEIKRSFPFIDIILGTHNFTRLPELIKAKPLFKKTLIEITDYNSNDYFQNIEDSASVSRRSDSSASVNIMYGCNNFCTYCIVPYVRGRERSRSVRNILTEINKLVTQGYKEVLLLGQNVNSYSYNNISFPQLLKIIAEKTGIKRIRFMTSHPKDLSTDLIKTVKRHSNICNQIHLPVQSGSSEILRKMNRGYTREEYLKLVADIRQEIPEITLSTDIIIGFPGETEKDFRDTLSLVKEADFDSAYTFIYSPRSGTKAAKMPYKVEKSICRDRIIELIDLQNQITFRKNSRMVNSIEQVLVEGLSTRDKNHICGKTEGGKTINFPGNEDLNGSLVNVRITEAKRTTLMGELV